MNLDKTIQELTNRLDEVHPYSAFSTISNYQNKNDGINNWKDKKIISTKDWNELYEKSSTYTNAYTTTLISRRPLQYFPDDYNGLISTAGVVDEKLKEEIQNWNTDYYELLEYRKNLTLGRMKCSKCLLSRSNDDPSNNKKIVSAKTITEPLAAARKIEQQEQDEQEYSHKGENRHSKKMEEIDREQQILLKDNKEAIIDFLLANKDSIKIEDLKIYEPIYKCYREKGNCHVCCSLSNIICISCNHNYNNNKEMWSCTNHWKQHALENHIRE